MIFFLLIRSHQLQKKWEEYNTKKVCPECEGNIFEEDTLRAETICRRCGLVILAPPTLSFTAPGFKVVERRRNLRVMSRFLKSWHIMYDFQ